MSRSYWYNSTTKKILVAFATIFDEISIEDDFGVEYKVPLIFSQKQKWYEAMSQDLQRPDMDEVGYDITFPRMGFELVGIEYDASRNLNPLQQIISDTEIGGETVTYNRVPYNLFFNLYIGARKIDDSLKILEQIVPYFAPELTVTIRDREDIQLETNIPIILNNVNLDIQNDGSFNQKRTVQWELGFTAKAYYYPLTQKTNLIKQTILELGQMQFNNIFQRYTSTVSPFEARKDEDYSIIDTVQVVNEI